MHTEHSGIEKYNLQNQINTASRSEKYTFDNRSNKVDKMWSAIIVNEFSVTPLPLLTFTLHNAPPSPSVDSCTLALLHDGQDHWPSPFKCFCQSCVERNTKRFWKRSGGFLFLSPSLNYEIQRFLILLFLVLVVVVHFCISRWMN